MTQRRPTETLQPGAAARRRGRCRTDRACRRGRSARRRCTWPLWLGPFCGLLVSGRVLAENPWRERVAPAVAKFEQHPAPETAREALEVCWRADDWLSGLKIARAALQRWPEKRELLGVIGRALWRAGQIEQAERLAARIPPTTRDEVALELLVGIHLANGRRAQARAVARRLERLPPNRASSFATLAAVAMLDWDNARLARLLDEALKRADKANGYPDALLIESARGLPEYLRRVGSDPLNQLVEAGQAELPQIVGLGVPGCDVLINGQGPFRLVLDTGGSVALTLDRELAERIGLKNLGEALVHGVEGQQASGQSVADRVSLGSIVLGRVMVRTIEMPAALGGLADGILGTGVFADARMTLDFANGLLKVEPSSDKPAPGTPQPLRIVGDGKLLTFVQVAGRRRVGLLDSGAQIVTFSQSLTTRHFDETQRTQLEAAGVGVGSGQQPKIGLVPGLDIELWGRAFPRYSGMDLDVLDTLLSPVLGVQIDVLVGMPLLRETRQITVDQRRCRLWVQWPEPHPASPQDK